MRARIKLTDKASETEIEIGGQRVEGAFRALTIEASAVAPPRISLELSVAELVDVEGEVQVLMTDATRRGLIALGWTPPPEG